jgi:hypothetical protein
MGDFYGVCPGCGSRNTYFSDVHKRRHKALTCRDCGWTSDHTLRQLRQSLGLDPATGKRIER